MTHAQPAKESTQLKAAGVVMSVAETIRELGTVPSGVLYASLMTLLPGITIESYQTILGVLKRTNLVEESGNVLTWTGPHARQILSAPVR